MIPQILLILTYIAFIMMVYGLYTNNLNLCGYSIIIILTIFTIIIITITLKKR